MRWLLALTFAMLLSCTTSKPPGMITIEGTVTTEGVECPAVRGDDGKLYTISGPARDKLKPGMRVRITGKIAEMSTCMQGTTISAESIAELAGRATSPATEAP